MDIDVNKPVEAKVLKGLLEEFAGADESNRAQVLEKIGEEFVMNAVLLAVMNIDDDFVDNNGDGTAVFKQGAKISFAMLSTEDGATYLPVFTDWTELRKAEQYKGAEVRTLIVRFDDMAAICKGKAGIVINPYSHNFVVSPKNVAYMKQRKDAMTKGYSEHVVKQATKVQIGDPADYPTEFTEAVVRYAKTNKAINAIWLKLMVRDGETSYLLIVDFTGDHREIFKSIADASRAYIRNGLYVDMVPYADKFGREAASGEPFYRKKKGLFGR